MKHIRTKFIILIVSMLVASVLIIGVISVSAIKKLGDESAAEKLTMLCETTQENLNAHLDNLRKSVNNVYHFAESQLRSLSYEDIQQNKLLVQELCKSVVDNTHGIVSYYYRIAPEVAGDTLGFWYVKDPDSGRYYMQPLTDLNGYDSDDLGRLGWYTIPKEEGKPVWLDPYVNENLNRQVISYTAPVMFGDTFVGVIGMDLDEATLEEGVKDIRIYDSGYAFLLNSENEPVYYPSKDGGDSGIMLTDEILTVGNQVHSYNRGGEDMKIIWRWLTNGMKVFVTAPESEINATWVSLTQTIVFASLILLGIFVAAAFLFSIGLTRPLQKLTDAAIQVNEGNYDVKLASRSRDEVGILTRTFRKLVDHLREYIGDLNDKVYSDALTSLRNKGAFMAMCQEMQKKAEDPSRKEPLEYAIIMFDCNNLKTINDVYGHEKGDIYLTNASSLICNVFSHSPVFRVGGDEFTLILQGHDFENRDALLSRLEMDMDSINAMSNNPWDEVHVAYGIGVYQPELDKDIDSVIKRADQNMYKKKKEMKQ